MPSHAVVASCPQVLFHSTARSADACGFQQYFPNLKLLMLQGQQVDTRHYNVSPQQLRWNLTLAQYPSHYIQMFLLNQRDLALASRGFLKVIAFEPCVRISLDFTGGVESPADCLRMGN